MKYLINQQITHPKKYFGNIDTRHNQRTESTGKRLASFLGIFEFFLQLKQYS